MKKLLLIAALIGSLGLGGYQVASAHMGGYGGGYGYCGDYGYGGQGYTEDDAEAISKFRAETVAIRRDLAVKRAELRALNRQDNPDVKRVAELTGEVFDLQTKLDQIAEKHELHKGGRGYGHGYGDHRGMMGDGGRGRGRHMMDW
jgi:hypothetical protein